jgi:C1A family cysteine protease
VETIKLFELGNKWSTLVLDQSHIQLIKEALWTYKSPILVNYNDENFWHVILIVGYDDNLPGVCYDTSPKECSGLGSFYVRDSFGLRIELRDYDWFRVKGNAAFVVKLK